MIIFCCGFLSGRLGFRGCSCVARKRVCRYSWRTNALGGQPELLGAAGRAEIIARGLGGQVVLRPGKKSWSGFGEGQAG